MTKYLEKGWTIAKKLFENASIAVGAYTVGDSHNDVEKLTHVLTKINAINNNETSNNEKYLIIALFLILTIVVIAFIAWFIAQRAIKRDRQIHSRRRMMINFLKLKLLIMRKISNFTLR